MIKDIVKDPIFLSKKSIDCTKDDLYIAEHLIDTLNANKEICVGMSASMIGYSKRMIIISTPLFPIIMINPVIKEKSNIYDTEESCLSLIGVRKCKRYKEIEVEYLDMNFNKEHNFYNGLTAEIIQHEIDHLEGILI